MFNNNLGKVREEVTRFNTVEGIEQSFEIVGNDLLTKMRQSELVHSEVVPSISDFTLMSAEEYFQAEEGTYVESIAKDNQFTTRIEYSKNLPEGEVVIKLFPQLAEAQGIVVNPTEVSIFKSQSGGTSENNYNLELEPQACTGSNCLQTELCRYTYTRHEQTELFCCYQDGEIVDCCWGSVRYHGCGVPDCDTPNCGDYCHGTCG
ncbi:hypothetical protein C439_18693 [Haloferax mediterranei ATCC 33500]|nr:hypothetical protein C439_18693 [Haloferax mediterranei ATCC 33500]